MSVNYRNEVAYGLSQSLLDISLRPIVANRAPKTTDYAPIGSLWVDTTADNAYILVDIANAVATWSQIDNSGGAGSFTSLTVTPGPISLTGATTVVGATLINASGAAATTLGTGGTGAVNIGNATGNTAVTGDMNVTSGTVTTATAGEGFRANPTTSAAGASPVVANAIHGQAVFTDVIADSASATLTVTNSAVSATSKIIASVSCVTVGAILVIGTITPGAGTVDFVVNNVSPSTATADNILINFWVMS